PAIAAHSEFGGACGAIDYQYGSGPTYGLAASIISNDPACAANGTVLLAEITVQLEAGGSGRSVAQIVVTRAEGIDSFGGEVAFDLGDSIQISVVSTPPRSWASLKGLFLE
ncbi:MAG: hypothetical protein KC591_14800, partial [Gemmatimonadetes bacterium]|nr:hypothetical protein [Gemmatimonadota bacterium]